MHLTTPLTDEAIAQLHAGDKVTITGVIYVGRDAAHKRLVAALDAGQPLPFDPQGQIIYYMGPSPARPGRPIGAAGPTTSYRMDPYAPRLMEVGLKGMIGKGNRAKPVRDAMIRAQGRLFRRHRRRRGADRQEHQERRGGRLRRPGRRGAAPAGGRGFPGHRHQRHLWRRRLRGWGQAVQPRIGSTQ